VYKYLLGRCKKNGAKLLGVYRDRTRSTGPKLKCKKFHLSRRKTFLDFSVQIEPLGSPSFVDKVL